MYTICGSCAAGHGTSLIAMNQLKKIITNMGYDPKTDFRVIHCDLGSIGSTDADLFITSQSFEKMISNTSKEANEIVYVKNIAILKGIEDTIKPYLEKNIRK